MQPASVCVTFFPRNEPNILPKKRVAYGNEGMDMGPRALWTRPQSRYICTLHEIGFCFALRASERAGGGKRRDDQFIIHRAINKLCKAAHAATTLSLSLSLSDFSAAFVFSATLAR